MKTVNKVQAFIVGKIDSKYKILIFEHGITKIHQCIRGTISSDEDIIYAAIREIEEESGLKNVRLIKNLGTKKLLIKGGPNRSGSLELQIHTALLFEIVGDVTLQWVHVATGSPEEDGIPFSYYWHTIDETLENILFEDFVHFLPELFVEINNWEY